MATTGIVTHYIGLGCQPPNNILDGNFVCDLRDSDLRSVFQERIPGVSKMRPTRTATANDYTTDVDIIQYITPRSSSYMHTIWAALIKTLHILISSS